MAYTNAWVTTVPLGTDNISGADDDIRRLRLDLEERLADIVGTLAIWKADPIDVNQERHQFLHWSACGYFPGAVLGTVTANALAAIGGGASLTVYYPVIIPRGCQLTKFAIQGVTNASGQMTIELHKADATGALSDTVLSTLSVPGSSPQGTFERDLTSAPITIDSNSANSIYYYISIVLANATATGDAKLDGLHLTYKASLLRHAI